MSDNAARTTFTDIHDQCLAAWTSAFQTGDATPATALISPHYQGVFGYAGTSRVEPVGHSEATTGLQQFVTARRGATHRAENRRIELRGDSEAVVSYERVLEHDGGTSARFFVIQTWRLHDGAWRVVRELAEHLGA